MTRMNTVEDLELAGAGFRCRGCSCTVFGPTDGPLRCTACRQGSLDMSREAMLMRAAEAVDPAVWAEALPIPTRSDTISWHARRQESIKVARRVLAATFGEAA